MTDEELSTSHVILKTIAEYLPVKIKNKTCTKEEPCVGRKGEEYKSEGIWLVPGTYKLVLYGENIRHIIARHGDKIPTSREGQPYRCLLYGRERRMLDL